MSVIAELASFVTGAKASALPASEQVRLRLHLTDTAVAALAGPRIPEGQALNNFGDDGALPSRIGRRAAAIRLTEIDDIHLPSCTTPSAGVVPVALGLAAHAQKFDAEEIASAIWVGTEITTRFGMAAAGPQILYRGIWPTYLAAPVAAAATAARILGLDETRTGQVLSLACMLMRVVSAGFMAAVRALVSLSRDAIASGLPGQSRGAAIAASRTYSTDLGYDTHGVALDRAHGPLCPPTHPFSGASAKSRHVFDQGVAAIEAADTLISSAFVRRRSGECAYGYRPLIPA